MPPARSGRSSPSRPCSRASTASPGTSGCRCRRGVARDPDDAQPRRSRRALRPPPLRGASPRRGRAPAASGREGRDRAPDRERLLLRLRVPGADPRGRSRRDRGGDPARDRRGPGVDAGSDRTRRRPRAVRGRGRAVQGRAGRRRGGRHLALHAGRLHRSLPRPPPPGLVPDQGRQADRPCRRLLARRREEHAADPDLRHGVLHAGRPRRLSRAARAGAGERSPPARHCSSTCSTSRTPRPARPFGTRRA